MIEYGRFFTKLYRIRRGYYRRNITIRLSVGYEYRLKNKEIFKEVFVSLRGRNIATFKFREQIKGQKLAKLNERIHQRDQHKCIYCGNRVDPG